MDDWLSKEWADHHARFSADVSGAIRRLAIRLRGMAPIGFFRRGTPTLTIDAARPARVALLHPDQGSDVQGT